MTLDQVPLHTAVTVSALPPAEADQHRLTALGLRQDTRVEVVRRAPFGGPLAVRVSGGGLLALRRRQAEEVLVVEVGADA